MMAERPLFESIFPLGIPGSRRAPPRRNPYRIVGPARLSISGGRTSAYLLYHLMEACDDRLPPDVVPIFANTGEEHEDTLAFVAELGVRYGIRIRWVEFTAEPPHWREVAGLGEASRNGEPYDALVQWKKYLPNFHDRLCTEWLKVRPMIGLMTALGYHQGSYDEILGIRADEPTRVAKHRAHPHRLLPLVDAGVSKPHVLGWWQEHPFDLRAPPDQGNCRLCFLKGLVQLQNTIALEPDEAGAERWSAREAFVQARSPRARFIKHGPTYVQLRERARRMPVLPGVDLEGWGLPCECHD